MKTILSLVLALATCACASPLQNVEGFAFVKTASGEPAFGSVVRGDIQTGFIYYGAEGDVGLRDAVSKFRFTLPIQGMKVGEIRYWDKRNGVSETAPIGSLLPDWLRDLFTPQEIELLGLTFQADVPSQ